MGVPRTPQQQVPEAPQQPGTGAEAKAPGNEGIVLLGIAGLLAGTAPPPAGFTVAGSIAALLLAIVPAGQVVADGIASLLVTEVRGAGTTGVVATQYVEELVMRARYGVAAIRRVHGAPDKAKALEAERRHFAAHQDAQKRRLGSARLVQAATETYGDLLGWRAVMDKSTTGECRDAHGKNFRASRKPGIGWPGSVHRFCRCSVGPPVAGAAELR